MTSKKPVSATTDSEGLPAAVAAQATSIAKSDGFQAKVYDAISVQRPVVLEYLRSLRREKPDASPAELLKELEKRYVATVTVASTGVGASAAIPAVGIPLALGLGVADLLFFYETSALYVLAVAELHDIEVHDVERARPLIFGILLGQKSQSQVTQLVMQASGAGGVSMARGAATNAVGATLSSGWGSVLTQQLPDSALAPLATVLAREALKASAKFGVGTLGKAIPFGLGAIIGGVGSYTFGSDVVKAAHLAFPTSSESFPESLANFRKPKPEVTASSRAAQALQAAAGGVAGLGGAVREKTTDAAALFRSVDLDGDGIPDEARAVTAAKRTGSAIKGAAVGGVGAVGSLFKKKGPREVSSETTADSIDDT